MSIFVKNDILYINNKPSFQYLNIVNIQMNKIFSILDGNIKAKYKGRIVRGILKGISKKGWYKVQLIKLL